MAETLALAVCGVNYGIAIFFYVHLSESHFLEDYV
jgi:hypothetical protein